MLSLSKHAPICVDATSQSTAPFDGAQGERKNALWSPPTAQAEPVEASFHQESTVPKAGIHPKVPPLEKGAGGIL